MRRRLPIVVVIGALVAAATSLAGPARAAAPAPGPVHGAHSSYRAVPLSSALPAPPAYDTWWFNGTAADQVGKIAGAPTATFSRSHPTGDQDVVQLATPLADQTQPGDAASAYWRGAYRGTIDGDLILNWYWSTVDPEAELLAEVVVTVWADTEMAAQPAKVGESRVHLRLATQPVESRTRVTVHAVVERSLLIQVSPVYLNVADDLRVSYGSAAHPSSFAVPRPVAGFRDRPATAPAPFRGERLDIQAIPVGHGASEPTMGVDRSGGAFYVATAYDPSTGVPSSNVMRSLDGGATWEDVSPSAAGMTLPPVSQDPYLYVDPRTDRVFSIDLTVACSYLSYSDDRGATWATNPAACGEPVNDHQSLVAGVPPPGLSLRGEYPDVIYYCFNGTARSACTRSVDGGTTFEHGRSDPFPGYELDKGFCSGLHGRAVTDARGRLFVPKGHCGFPWVAVSEDGGDTWRRSQVSKDISSSGVNVQLAVDEGDNLYAVWWDEEFRLPWMAVSRDHGATWGPSLLIAPPDVKQVNFPSIAAGAPGRLAVTFPGTTVLGDSPFRPWNSYVLVSTNALDTRPLFQSATANSTKDPIHRGGCEERCGGMLDFLDAVVSPAGEAWGTVVDTCTDADECITNQGPDQPPAGVSTSNDGIAVRQLCGPRLRGAVADLHGAGCVTDMPPPPPNPPRRRGRDGLPRTTG